MNRYFYFLKAESFYRPLERQRKKDNNLARIAAGCEEHGLDYFHFMSTLKKTDIFLETAMLARLAIYEPKTFKSLVDIAKEMTKEPLEPANFNESRL